jgi:hypothetical protein
VAVGVALRAWIVSSPLGLVDGDEAVVGLMARRALDGSFQAFFWGQEYGGSQEALLVAALLALRVPARWAMELVPIGLHAGAAVLVWRIGLRTIDRPGGAALAAGICWAGSPALLWWSTKERGFYGFTLVCGLAALLLVLRPLTVRSAALLGLVLGLGWWASPQILHFAVPALAWLVWRERGAAVRHLAVAAPAAVVGALPWLWANLQTGLASLEPAADRTTFGDPLPIFFRYGVPMVLGLKEPITLGWRGVWGRPLYGLVLLGLVVVLVIRPRGLRPVLLAIAAYPLIFALLPTTYYYGEPRYLDFLWPLLALVAGWAAVRLPAAVLPVVVVAFVALTATGVDTVTELRGPRDEPFEDISPEPVDAVVARLADLRATHVFADYWLAYRLTWETDGGVVATPLAPERDPQVAAEVRRHARPAYVHLAPSCRNVALKDALEAEGVTFTTHDAGIYEVVLPARRVHPEDLALRC